MILYEFRCPSCGQVKDVWRNMGDAVAYEPCACGGAMRREYTCNIHGDEIKSCTYVDPKTCKETKNHGRFWDMGLGKWYTHKSQRKRYMKELGLKEVGGREV